MMLKKRVKTPEQRKLEEKMELVINPKKRKTSFLNKMMEISPLAESSAKKVVVKQSRKKWRPIKTKIPVEIKL